MKKLATLPWIVLLIVALATAARVAVGVGRLNAATPLYSDMKTYDDIAHQILTGHRPTWSTLFPVGYPLFLATIFAVTRHGLATAGVVQAIGGGFTCLLVWVIARRLASSSMALIPLVLVAAYPPAIYYGAMLLTESVSPFCLALAFWLLLRAGERPSWTRSAFAGMSLGIATLVRSNFLLLYPFVLFFLWCASRPNARAAWRTSAQMVVFSLLVLLPASLANSKILRRPSGLSTNGGLNFFMAQADVRTVSCADGTWAPARNLWLFTADYRTSRWSSDEAFFYREGISAFLQRKDKLDHLLLNLSEGLGLGLQAFWPADEPIPEPADKPWAGTLDFCSRAFVWILIVPLSLYAVYSAGKRRIIEPREAPWLLAYGSVTVLVVTSMLFEADPRLHVPFDPVLIAFAVPAVSRLMAGGIGTIRDRERVRI